MINLTFMLNVNPTCKPDNMLLETCKRQLGSIKVLKMTERARNESSFLKNTNAEWIH